VAVGVEVEVGMGISVGGTVVEVGVALDKMSIATVGEITAPGVATAGDSLHPTMDITNKQPINARIILFARISTSVL